LQNKRKQNVKLHQSLLKICLYEPSFIAVYFIQAGNAVCHRYWMIARLVPSDYEWLTSLVLRFYSACQFTQKEFVIIILKIYFPLHQTI